MATGERTERASRGVLKMCWVGICMVVLLALPSGCEKRRETAAYPVFGKMPIYDAWRDMEPGEKIRKWADLGLRDMTVIHVSSESGLEYIAEKRVGSPGQGEGVLSAGNALYAAARRGIVGKVFWVVPDGFWKSAGAGERAKLHLKSADTIFPAGEVDALTMSEGCLTGSLQGVSLAICPPYALPHIDEPVILDIDTGFFPRYAAEQGVSPLRGAKMFLDKLALRGFRIVSVHVGEVPGARYPGPVFRHLGEEAVEMITNPAVLQAQAPPELWAVRDATANMLAGGESELVLEYLGGEEGRRFPDDPALRSMRSVVLGMLGDYDDAMVEAASVCEAMPAYCDLFIEIGDRAWNGGDAATAERFLQEAVRARPGWAPAEYRMGDLMVALGRIDEAEARYTKALEAGETVEGRLRLGDTAFLHGREDDAAKAYARAVELSGGRIGVRPTTRNRESLGRAVSLFEKKGEAGMLVLAKEMILRMAEPEGTEGGLE